MRGTGSLGLLLICLATGAHARDWSRDWVVSEAVGPVLERLSPSTQAGINLQSHSVLRYGRRPNWWAACFLAVGYMPVSFRASVKCEMRVVVRTPAGVREFSAEGSAQRVIWGHAPNPDRPAQDYERMETEARKQAASLVAGQVAAWFKHEGT